jgi:hypothetical protein
MRNRVDQLAVAAVFWGSTGSASSCSGSTSNATRPPRRHRWTLRTGGSGLLASYLLIEDRELEAGWLS